MVSAGLCVYTHLAPALIQRRVSGDGPKSRFPLLLCAKHPSDPDVENQRWLNCEGGKGQGLPSQESTVVTNTGFLPYNYGSTDSDKGPRRFNAGRIFFSTNGARQLDSHMPKNEAGSYLMLYSKITQNGPKT